MLKHYRPSHAEWLAGHSEEIQEGVRVWSAKVPRTPDIFAKCVFYIYPNEDEAKQGNTDSATGFFFHVPSSYIKTEKYLYAITNWHVIDQIETPTLRINKNAGSGGFGTIVTKKEGWTRHPLGSDLAIHRFDTLGMQYTANNLVSLEVDFLLRLQDTTYNFSSFHRDFFPTKDFMEKQHVGVGDDVFMIGNFQTRGGKKKNIPTTRFGNIAQMPDEPMKNRYTGYDEESFIVEMRSASGYSGSPVMLSIPNENRNRYIENKDAVIPRRTYSGGVHEHFMLLGIDWGHIQTREYLYDQDGKKLPNSESIQINSAMAGVVPYWKLEELIFSPEEEEIRRKKDEERQRGIDQSETAVD